VNSPVTLLELDCDLRFRWIYNPSIEQSAEQIIGKKLGETGTVNDITSLREFYQEVLRTGIPKRSEVLLEQSSGSTYYDIYAEPLWDEQGRIIGLTSSSTDITESKKDEQALRESEQRFRLVAETAKVMVYEMEAGKDTVKVFSGEEVLGYDKGEIPLSNVWWFSQIHKDDTATVERLSGDIWQTGKEALLEYRIKRKQGDYIYVHDMVKALTDKKGKVVRLIGAVRDITKRKEEERALLQNKELLEQKAAEVEKYATNMESLANERLRKLKEAERLAAIGATAGMVGHDIRNPLQAITGDVYLLKDYLAKMPESETKRDVAESLGGIENNVSYINKIVLDLQDYARKLTPECSFVNLTGVVKETIKAVHIPADIEVVTDVNYIELKTDQAFVRRALTNLINNALQAMPQGGKLTITAQEHEGNVMLSVEDTGVGIPDDVKPKLFMPMMTTKSKGQGLGLAVVKRLVEALGGTIRFTSEVGKGTKFVVELPQTR
jgi:PAS domain S-box-containing protein